MRAVRGSKGTPAQLLAVEQHRSGLTVTRWRAPSGHYVQVVLPPEQNHEGGIAHAKQFVTTHVRSTSPDDSHV